MDRPAPHDESAPGRQSQHYGPDVTSRPVDELMRPRAFSIDTGESVLMAWELMERSHTRHLPVVSPDGRCVGLLDRAGLAVACAAPATVLSRRCVGDLLRGHRPPVVQAGESVRRAANIMTCTGVDALPVLGEHGRLVGLLAATDIVAALTGGHRGTPPGEPPQVPFRLVAALPPRRYERETGVP